MRHYENQHIMRRIALYVRLVWLSPELLALAKSVVRDHVEELKGGACDCPRCKEAVALIAKAEGGSDETRN